MIIHTLRLQNVRKHTDSSFEFAPGVNVLVGPNACGKTTVLEAIAITARGSLPTGRVRDLTSHGADWLRTDMHDDSSQRTLKITNPDSPAKVFELPGGQVARLRHDQLLPVVWFDPEELRLLRGSPARRRDYLDNLLSQLDATYLNSLRQYNRALKQRNALLKSAQFTTDQMFVWNVRLVEHAKYIHAQRIGLVSRLGDQLEATYSQLAGKQKDIEVRYESHTPSSNYGEALLSQLEARLPRDRMMGYTSVGPHRDDLAIYDETGQLLSLTASRGEIRTLVLSLKVIEVSELEQRYSSKPVLLFDDVFSELDGARRRAFTEYLKDHQAIITTTDADIVTKDFAKTSKIIAISPTS